jgi:hypothetical protein
MCIAHTARVRGVPTAREDECFPEPPERRGTVDCQGGPQTDRYADSERDDRRHGLKGTALRQTVGRQNPGGGAHGRKDETYPEPVS